MVAWKEVSESSIGTETKQVVNILDVRPARLTRVYYNSENVFEMSKKIPVPGDYAIEAFEHGFFGYEYIKTRRVVKLKIFDLEEVCNVLDLKFKY